MGAASTTTGWASTARWTRPGKQDRKVQPDVNQWQNPLKQPTGSNLADMGRTAVRARVDTDKGDSLTVNTNGCEVIATR